MELQLHNFHPANATESASIYYCYIWFLTHCYFSSVPRGAAYLHRKDYNVFTVDWEPLTFFPCYLSSLSNTKLVAQCAAQFYAHLTYSGASAFDIHCVGHSLGAHVCGMMSNHLTHRQHKIIGKYFIFIYYIIKYPAKSKNIRFWTIFGRKTVNYEDIIRKSKGEITVTIIRWHAYCR